MAPFPQEQCHISGPLILALESAFVRVWAEFEKETYGGLPGGNTPFLQPSPVDIVWASSLFRRCVE